MEKVCMRCNLVKSFKKFKMDNRNEDGRTKTCRDCYTNNKLSKFFRTPEQIASQRQKLKGRKYSLKHRLAISKGQLNAVKKGIHPFKIRNYEHKDQLRTRLAYKLWREKVFETRGKFCEICKVTKSLHVHHVKCFYKFPELALDVNNGQVLCVSCHMKITRKEKNFGKKLKEA